MRYINSQGIRYEMKDTILPFPSDFIYEDVYYGQEKWLGNCNRIPFHNQIWKPHKQAILKEIKAARENNNNNNQIHVDEEEDDLILPEIMENLEEKDGDDDNNVEDYNNSSYLLFPFDLKAEETKFVTPSYSPNNSDDDSDDDENDDNNSLVISSTPPSPHSSSSPSKRETTKESSQSSSKTTNSLSTTSLSSDFVKDINNPEPFYDNKKKNIHLPSSSTSSSSSSIQSTENMKNDAKEELNEQKKTKTTRNMVHASKILSDEEDLSPIDFRVPLSSSSSSSGSNQKQSPFFNNKKRLNSQERWQEEWNKSPHKLILKKLANSQEYTPSQLGEEEEEDYREKNPTTVTPTTSNQLSFNSSSISSPSYQNKEDTTTLPSPTHYFLHNTDNTGKVMKDVSKWKRYEENYQDQIKSTSYPPFHQTSSSSSQYDSDCDLESYSILSNQPSSSSFNLPQNILKQQREQEIIRQQQKLQEDQQLLIYQQQEQQQHLAKQQAHNKLLELQRLQKEVKEQIQDIENQTSSSSSQSILNNNNEEEEEEQQQDKIISMKRKKKRSRSEIGTGGIIQKDDPVRKLINDHYLSPTFPSEYFLNPETYRKNIDDLYDMQRRVKYIDLEERVIYIWGNEASQSNVKWITLRNSVFFSWRLNILPSALSSKYTKLKKTLGRIQRGVMVANNRWRKVFQGEI